MPLENIMFVSLLSAPMGTTASHATDRAGLHAISYAFPKVRVVTAAVDPKVNSDFYIVPGIGALSPTSPHV